MKKTYVKPYIAVESFQLDAAIAVACSAQGYLPIGYGENSCGYGQIGDKYWQFFNLDNCEMDLTGPGGDGNDTECYHGPMLYGATFISS